MRFSFFVLLTVSTSPALAQQAIAVASVQQPNWLDSPDGGAITIHVGGNIADGQAGPILGKGFSGTEVRASHQILPDGTHVEHSDTSHFYRDAQGRMRDEGTRYAVLLDPIGDATYTLHLKDKTYDQFPAGGGKQLTTIAAYGNSNDIDSPGITGPVQKVKWGSPLPFHTELVTHVDTVQLGQQMINGVTCRGTRVTMTIPAGAIGNDREIHVVNERWYSDELMVLVKSSNNDPRFGTTTYELKDVKRAEPDPSLFKVPEGFAKNSHR